MKSPSLRVAVLCDARGRILVAMAMLTVAAPRPGDRSVRPGTAGLMAGRGTTVYELDVPADLVSPRGGLQALMSGYSVTMGRGIRGGPRLVPRRGKR